MSKKLLTLNIGASSIALAEYEAGGKSLTLVNYGTAALAAPLDSGNADAILSPALLEIVREKGIRPGKVSISLSGQMAFPRFAAIPAAGGSDRFEQLVRAEIEQNIPFPIDEMVCDRAVLGDTPDGDKAVMVVAAKVDQVEAITSAVASAGFSPEIVDVAPLAVTNVLRASPSYDGGCAVILDIGAKTSSLVIVEGEKLYNRSIPVAGNAITKEIAQIFGCTLEEAEGIKRENAYVSMGGVEENEDENLDRIAKACRNVMTRLHAEISRSINFYRSQQGGGTPTKLYLTGGSSLLAQTDAFFRDSLQLEVEYLNPFDVIGVGGSVDQAALESDAVLLSATAGVALHAAGLASIEVNLLPPSIVDARAEAARVPFVAVGSVALVAAMGLWLFASMQETAKVEEQLETATAEADKLSGYTASIEKAKKAEDEAWGNATNLAARLSRRGAEVAKFNAVRKALEHIHSGLWIAEWQDAVETKEIDDPKAPRNKPRKIQVSTPVTKLKVRCWRDTAEEIEGRRAAAPAPQTPDSPESRPDLAAKAGERGLSRDAADPSPDSPETSQTSQTFSRETVDMIIVKRLYRDPLVAEAIKDKSPSYGKGDGLKEYNFTIRFKAPEFAKSKEPESK